MRRGRAAGVRVPSLPASPGARQGTLEAEPNTHTWLGLRGNVRQGGTGGQAIHYIIQVVRLRSYTHFVDYRDHHCIIDNVVKPGPCANGLSDFQWYEYQADSTNESRVQVMRPPTQRSFTGGVGGGGDRRTAV